MAGLVFRADSSVHELSLEPFSVGVSPLNHIWEIRVMIFSILPRMILSSTILDACEFLVYNGRLRARFSGGILVRKDAMMRDVF